MVFFLVLLIPSRLIWNNVEFVIENQRSWGVTVYSDWSGLWCMDQRHTGCCWQVLQVSDLQLAGFWRGWTLQFIEDWYGCTLHQSGLVAPHHLSGCRQVYASTSGRRPHLIWTLLLLVACISFWQCHIHCMLLIDSSKHCFWWSPASDWQGDRSGCCKSNLTSHQVAVRWQI